LFPLDKKNGVANVADAGPPPGCVYWITGLSGAGKTTIGRKLWSRLRDSGRPAIFLDGDILRGVVAEDLGHGAEHRRVSAMRNGRICRMLSDQGTDVVCATISLFHEVQCWNRENIADYREIYLKVPLDELERRDAKGIYAGARRGEITNVVGIDVVAEEPVTPDLVIENHAALCAEAAVELIWNALVCGERCPQAGDDAAPVQFGTKGETLERLASRLRSAEVLPQIRFDVAQWRRDQASVLARVTAARWSSDAMIVRSSATSEDGAEESAAGKYTSVANVTGHAAVVCAVETVIASFDDGGSDEDQVFIQPMLRDVAMAGVAFTRDPNGGGPYYVINYDDASGRTDLVTSGSDGDFKTFICLKSRPERSPASLAPILALLAELEAQLRCDAIDVEFAVDGQDKLFLLQVRPLVTDQLATGKSSVIDASVDEIACKLELLSRPHPYLHGSRSVFGVMPDWNPAEIIGLRPRPLSLSLYRELVTDAIWAYQRDNYGYRNLRSFPLMVSFHGLPYIDVRVSFNSFVPRDIDGALAERLVNYYIDRLVAEPNLHDKVEFEIIFSCYTLDLPDRLSVLKQYGFSDDDRAALAGSLRHLTNSIINETTGLWHKDREKIDILAQRLQLLRQAPIDKISRVYWLIEDCKRYGTLPFAGLARAGFIAVQLLQSLVAAGVLDSEEYAIFLANLETVGSRIGRDFASQPKDEFLRRYGHLRPGTYDILSPRYDEDPELYFDWSAPRGAHSDVPRFALSVAQLRHIERLLKEHRLEYDVLGLIEFIKAGIEGREFAKFVFTQSLSDALSCIKQLGHEHGFSPEDCAFLDFAAVRALYSESAPVAQQLAHSIAEGKRRYELTRSLRLPPLLVSPDDAYAFHLPATQPNFVTRKCVTGAVATISDPPERHSGSILFIPSADPGFDWIFTRGIAGFVTQFGGVNSHMAIRAGELGVPAVIGAGEALFQRWRTAQKICLDCGNGQVQQVA
jgi:glutamine kinase